MKNIVIIGAGPAGLTAAYELTKTPGEYTVWVHAYELTNAPNQVGAWMFTAAVDGERVGVTFGGGNRSASGFVWKNGGTFNLSAGTHEISLIDLYGDWPRCDAIFVTNDADLVPSNDFETLKQQAASGGTTEEEENTEYFVVDNTAEGTQKAHQRAEQPGFPVILHGCHLRCGTAKGPGGTPAQRPFLPGSRARYHPGRAKYPRHC